MRIYFLAGLIFFALTDGLHSLEFEIICQNGAVIPLVVDVIRKFALQFFISSYIVYH